MPRLPNVGTRIDHEPVAKTPPKLVDIHGRPCTPASWQKNGMYARAKELREKIRQNLLTHTEHWQPTEHNILKFRATEGSVAHNKMVQEYRNLMTVIGADPRDMSVEALRKGR